MSKPEDSPPNDLGAVGRANTREANAFWVWRDRPIMERPAALDILQAGGVKVEGIISRKTGEDPPDCEGVLDGRFSGVEVTELVDQETLQHSIRATRAAGKQSRHAEACLAWDRNTLLSELQALIDRKDRKTQKGGPYERYALVVPTDETFLDRDITRGFLEGATFQSKLITDVFFALSYHDGCCPVFHFAASQQATDGTLTLKLQPSLFVPRYDVLPFSGSMAETFPRGSMIQLILKRASASRAAGLCAEHDDAAVADAVVVAGIWKVLAPRGGSPWRRALACGQHEDRTPPHGCAEPREPAMAAFAKSWRRK